MQAMLWIMLILIFAPVVWCIFVLVKRIREMPPDNRAHSALLEEMNRLSQVSKANRKSSEEIKEPAAYDAETAVAAEPEKDQSAAFFEDEAVRKARESAAALFSGASAGSSVPSQEDPARSAALDDIMSKMISGKGALSQDELRNMAAGLKKSKQ